MSDTKTHGAPRIAIILDENTSVDGTRYDMSKDYFSAIHRAGGLPYGIPYFAELVAPVVAECDGYVSVGGSINFPSAWYVDGDQSRFAHSDRLAVDIALMRGFLARGKPVLGICNGMQMLACLHGCRMVSDVRATGPDILVHQARGSPHPVAIWPGTQLAGILGITHLDVNTRHREAVVETAPGVVAAAHAADGTIEAIELPAHRFAVGVQWHPEAFVADTDNPGNRIFRAFVDAARDS